MKNIHRTLAIFILIALLFIAVFSMSGCQYMLDSLDENKHLAESYVDAIIDDDINKAYSLLSNSISEDKHDEFFASIKKTFGNAKDYTITVTGVNYGTSEDGRAYSQCSYQVETDNDKIIQVTIVVLDSAKDEIYNLNIRDSGPFIESTGDLLIPNIVLVAYSLFCLVFTVMMIYDCSRRKIEKKALWIFIIILGLMLTLSFRPHGISLNFIITIPLSFSGLVPNIPTETVAFNLLFPIGAIVYLFMRKKLVSNNQSENTETNDY